ncbi:MAG: hypothetical protein ACPG19_08975 [Saprospiraceae bacterium]
MFRKKYIIPIIIGICGVMGLFSFQNNQSTNLSSEEAIEIAFQNKINELKIKFAQSCEKRVMETAVPIADSLIAEMYARDLRAQDTILLRPKRPEMPTVDINPFPFDSIE